MENIYEQYDGILQMFENLLDNLKALHTDIVNASETDGIAQEDIDELDWMYITVGSAMQSVEEVSQVMAR